MSTNLNTNIDDHYDVTSYQQEINTSATLNRRYCGVMNAFEITFNIDKKQTARQNKLYMFSWTRRNRLYTAMQLDRIAASTDSDDAYIKRKQKM